MDPRHRSLRLVLAALRGSEGPSPAERQDVDALPMAGFDELTARIHERLHQEQMAKAASGALRLLLDHGLNRVAVSVVPGAVVFVIVEGEDAKPVSPETPESGAHELAGLPSSLPGTHFPEDDGSPAT